MKVSVGLVISKFLLWQIVLQSQGVIANDGSSAFIYFPGQGPIELACNAEELPAGGIPLWSVNGTFFTLSSLRNGNLQNHNVTGTSIVINVPVNNTEYSCAKATADSEIFSDSIFVYIAAAPDQVPNFTGVADSTTLEGNTLNITLSWGEPFNNFDPIANYTVTCSGEVACPSSFTTTDNSTTSYSIINLNATAIYSLNVTATNSLGSAEPAIFMTTIPSVPDEVTGLSLNCELSQNEFYNNCTAEWNPVTIGNGPLEQPLLYRVYYDGYFVNVTGPTTYLTFRAPPVPSGYIASNVTASVTAINRFGAGPPSDNASAEVMTSSVIGITATPNTDIPSNATSYTIICSIHSESTADECEVTVASSEMTITNSSSVINESATIIISGLNCQQTYTVTAGGTVSGTLSGPRSSHGNITTGDCQIVPNEVTGLDLTCELAQRDLELRYICTAEWNPVTVGNGPLEQPLLYKVYYDGDVVNVTSPMTQLTRPANVTDGSFVRNVTVSVTAVNRFGTGPPSDNVSVEIMASSVIGITATPNTDAPSNTYNYTIICTIHPESIADECEVTIRDNQIFIANGSAAVIDGNATIIIPSLNCSETYQVIAGGTVDGMLEGPRSLIGIFTDDCMIPVAPTTPASTLSTVIVSTMSVSATTTTPMPTAGTSGAATIGTTCRMIIITITTTIITMMMQG